MDQHTLRYSVTPAVDFTNETLALTTECLGQQVSRDVMRLKERAIRQALIALGWTPPGIADRLAVACRGLQDDDPSARHVAREALKAYENIKKQ